MLSFVSQGFLKFSFNLLCTPALPAVSKGHLAVVLCWQMTRCYFLNTKGRLQWAHSQYTLTLIVQQPATNCVITDAHATSVAQEKPPAFCACRKPVVIVNPSEESFAYGRKESSYFPSFFKLGPRISVRDPEAQLPDAAEGGYYSEGVAIYLFPLASCSTLAGHGIAFTWAPMY